MVTMDGRSAAIAVEAKKAPLMAAAAIDRSPKDFMVTVIVIICDN